MKRKMWALIYGIELRGKTTDGRAEIYFDKKLAESYKGKQDELKPVIVTDEDPFANVRKVYKSSGFKDLDLKNIASMKDKNIAHWIACCLHGAIQKAIQNFDKG